MAKVGFTTKDGTVVSFTTKKRASRKNATTALATRANKRKPAKRKPAARKPVKRTPVARGKDKATYKFYVVFRGPPKGLNIHAGFATQQAARAFITKKFRGTRRLQVRGRPGLVKSGFNPKVAANWKTFSLAASLKAMPAPRKRAAKRTTRRNSSVEMGPFWEKQVRALEARLQRTDDPIERESILEDLIHYESVRTEREERASTAPRRRKPTTRRNGSGDYSTMSDAQLASTMDRLNDELGRLHAKWLESAPYRSSASRQAEAAAARAAIDDLMPSVRAAEAERNRRLAERDRRTAGAAFVAAADRNDMEAASRAFKDFESAHRYLTRGPR